jgi:hypothetical protein
MTMVSLLVVVIAAIGFGIDGFPLQPLLLASTLLFVSAWVIRFGPDPRAFFRSERPWYRRW